jgi:Carboxypeptidase regulatory-like domain/TonB dependent receptor
MRSMRMYIAAIAAIAAAAGCLLVPLTTRLHAQEARGTIQGRVSDESGGVVPGAAVEVANTATGLTTSTTSNDEGNYRVPFLNPGTYRVTVTLDGFSKFVSQDVALHVADVLTIDATLKPGALSDEVTVTATPAAVDGTSAGLGQVVDARRISELPIREGSAVELVILAPGVANTTDLRSRKAAFNNGLSQFSSDGAGEKRNDFTIDGVANVAADRVAYSPPSAAVEEFKIQTATYDAAVGNTMGASVNLVTKSGTNSLRGQVYEWYRGSALDANNFFDNRNGRPKRDYMDNRFGVAIGGPVLRNRTFYFANVEFNPFEVPSPQIVTVPTAKMRNGDFSELLALGPQYQIYDPATIRPHPTQAGRFTRDPFPGNIIPEHRLDPVARKILEYYPLPNQQGTADGTNNYANPTAVALETYYTATTRVDHSLSDRHRIYGRYSWDFWEEEKDNRFDNVATGIFLNRKNRVFAIDDAYTFKNNMLTNVRAGFTRQLFPERRRSQGFDLASLGFSPALVGLIPSAELATFPNITFDGGGYQPLSGWESGDGFFTTDVYNVSGSVMWLTGNHNLKFGTEYRRYVENSSRYQTAVSPVLNFSTNWTRGPLDNSAAAPRGQDLASFLLGLPTGGSMSIPAEYTERSGVIGFYAHDDWRIRSNLTLNLGIRYEIEEPLTEADNRMISGFDFNSSLPIADAARAAYGRNPIPEIAVQDFAVRGGVLYPDTGGPNQAWKRNLSNFMPRAGFSWQPDPKTAVRGGYGLFYDVLGPNRISVNQTGYSRSTALTPSLDNGQTFVGTLANPFPTGLLEPLGSGLGLMTGAGLNVSFPYVGEVKTPRTHRWSIGIQRELPWQFMVEGTYVGSHSENIPIPRDLNPIPGQYLSTSPVRDDATNNYLTQQVPNPFVGLLPGTTLNGTTVSRSQLLRPFPQFTTSGSSQGVEALETIGQSDYSSFQGRIERRMANGFTLQVGYSWSKSMGELNFRNPFDTVPERVIGQFDRTHVFVTSGIVELPFGHGRRYGQQWNGLVDGVLGGWQVSFLFKAQSGAPLGFNNGGGAANTTLGSNIVLRDGFTMDDVALPADQRTVDRWFNVDAFERATNRQLVSNVRTLPTRFEDIRGPGYAVLDLGILKNVDLTSRLKLQLRAEAYNALNTTNLGTPNTAPTNTAFGTITAQNGLPRQFQLAARVSF